MLSLARQVRAVKSAVAQRESELSDGCVLEVVSPLRTLPSEVALCVGHKAGVKLGILGGSRHIRAEVNDSSVVKAAVHGHDLELVPKSKGATTVLLKDQITRLEVSERAMERAIAFAGRGLGSSPHLPPPLRSPPSGPVALG